MNITITHIRSTKTPPPPYLLSFISFWALLPPSLLPPYLSAVFMHLSFPAALPLCSCPRFLQSRCHAALCGSSGDELPLLVSSLFILQPYQPRCRVSSRQLQSRLPNLIMSSDRALHTEHTHREHARIHYSKWRHALIRFTSSPLTHQHVQYIHTLTHTHIH